MPYQDYIPAKALIAKPITNTYKLTVTNPHTLEIEDLYERVAYESLLESFGVILVDNNGNYTFIESGVLSGNNGLDTGYDFADYDAGSITINKGDYLNFYDVGLRFRYAGVDPLIFSKATNNDWYDKNPLLLDDDGERVNSNLWASYGSTASFLAKDGSNASELEITDDFIGNNSMYLKASLDVVGAFNEGMFFSGVKCSFAYVKVYDELLGLVIDEFEIDMTFKTKLFIKHTGNGDIMNLHPKKYEVYFAVGNPDSITVSSAIKVKDARTPVSAAAGEENMLLFGSTLYGHSQNRVSEFKTVISDNTEKQMVIKSYDVFGGHALVDEADLQKVEHVLAKATQGDYIFHIGSLKEIYDQRVYLCKLKYSSPIEDGSDKFKIQISGQSLAHKVENPLIAPDSTDGYPV